MELSTGGKYKYTLGNTGKDMERDYRQPHQNFEIALSCKLYSR